MRKEQHRGTLPFPLKQYGKTALGAPLLYAPCKQKCALLAIAGIHGEEAETTFLLSRILRLFAEPLQSVAFVLCANPDGAALGTRGNSNGVDLNRNFPTANWSPQTTLSKATLESKRITELSPGKTPASEAETKSLIKLIRKLQPAEILSIHSPLACVDAPAITPLTHFLTEVSQAPYKKNIGYPTPGSLGTWCGENSIHCVTWELPRLAPEILAQKFARKVAFYFLHFSHGKLNLGIRKRNPSSLRRKFTSTGNVLQRPELHGSQLGNSRATARQRTLLQQYC